MKTQLVGYADENGVTKPIVVAWPEVTREKQMEIWIKAKTRHVFPSGVKRLVLEERTETHRAIFVADHVSEELEAFEAARANREKAVAALKQAAQKKITDTQNATAAISKTAVARNAANAEVNTAKQLVDNAKSNADSAPDKKIFQQRLSDAQSRLDKANAAFTAADKAWTDAKAAKAALDKPAEK